VDSIVDETGAAIPARDAGYPIEAGWFDEAFEPGGEPRANYRPLIEALGGIDLGELRAGVAAELEARGVGFRTADGEAPFVVDPVPRLVEAGEWDAIAAGVAQRVRALNAFLADIYSGERRIVVAGVVPGRVIDSSDGFEPDLVGLDPPPVAHVAGLDLVRGADGSLAVLEDNLRSPSGIAYALAAREAVAPRIPGLEPANDPAAAFELLGEALRAAAPPRLADAAVVVLSDGPEAAARFEHGELAAKLGLRLAAPEELEKRGGGIALRDDAGNAERVGVVYRRTDADLLSGPDGSPTALGELLGPAIRRGRLACANSFGTGLADDKLVHAYVEAMIGFYLGEEALIPSVKTYDLGDPGQRGEALNRLDHLVVKPRSGLGGSGVVILSRTSTAQARRIQAQLTREPGRLIAQELVRLSRHPTATDDGLRPRHVDLRPYALTIAGRVEVGTLPLTRYARQSEAMIVNSSQGGGGKDTWVMPR
jgi:carboxylate-amine ligase